MMPNESITLGSLALGLDLVGLVVLWTGFRKGERWAWFVMLIIFLSFENCPNAITLFPAIVTGSVDWHEWSRALQVGFGPYIDSTWFLLKSLVNLFALLLPVKAFFWRPSKTAMQIPAVGSGSSDV